MLEQSTVQRLVRLFPQSLIAEINRIFGAIATEKLMAVFAGTTIYIPSTKDLELAERDLAIHDTLLKCTTRAQSRRMGVVMCAQYRISRKELRDSYKKVRFLLRDGKKHIEADVRTSLHQTRRRKIKTKRRSKRRI